MELRSERRARGGPDHVPVPGCREPASTTTYSGYYASEFGAYLSPDPLGSAVGPNPCAYVPNPLTLSDSLGLAVCKTIPDITRDHTLDGVFTPDGRFAGWHRHPDQTGGISPDHYIKGERVTNPDGTVIVLDSNGRPGEVGGLGVGRLFRRT
ncbi:hypothetical protein LO772_01525 [Yinghuangia sp. ASG 101]|uniref:hypothetical protein n=1 Tax=Yinghuangia sp. ASG 101 TaxID=2896848 RepID=UPI001E2F86E2|nr:hypothetical protein [Yinghuangia sp. ASG 101]UGQ12319.1 hypothetical protein LO772_01525 [Yinghuangia sp. ASG 101]